MLLGREKTFGVAKLARLCLLIAEPESEGETPCECAPAQVEHTGSLYASVAEQRDIGRAAADVNKDATFGPRLLACARSGERIRLRDCPCQLEVELTHDGVDRVDVCHRR